MLACSASKAALSVAVVAGFAIAPVAPAYGADPVLDGTYRFDFDGSRQTSNGGPLPTGNTTARYSFTSSCAGNGCSAIGVLLSSTDKEAVSAHNPYVTLQFADGAWQMSLPYDSACEEGGERNQLLTWSLTPQDGSQVLSGTRTVATIGNSCAGDDTGSLTQVMTATRIDNAAPGVLPMP